MSFLSVCAFLSLFLYLSVLVPGVCTARWGSSHNHGVRLKYASTARVSSNSTSFTFLALLRLVCVAIYIDR